MNHKKRNRIIARICAFTLAFFMVVTNAVPGTVRASEIDSNASASEAQNIAKPDENNADSNKETGSKEEAQSGKTDESVNKESNNQNTVQEDASEEPEPDGYDTVQPIIEDVQFAENGDTLEPDGKLHFTVKAYDANSEIREIRVEIQDVSDSNGMNYQFNLDKSETEENTYTSEYPVEMLYGAAYKVTRLWAVDTRDNVKEWEVEDGSKNAKYQFNINRESVTGPKIESVTLETKGDTVTAGDKVNIRVKITAENGLENWYSHIYIRQQEGMDGETDIELTYDEGTQTYTGVFEVTKTTRPGKWVTNLYVYDDKGFSAYFNSTDVYFTVVQDNFDTEKPVITDLKLDQQGNKVTPGNAVNITVKATDNAGLKEHGKIEFNAAADNIDNPYRSVELSYNKEKGEYTGTFLVDEDTYPCEWYVTNLYIYDTSGNQAELSEYNPHYWMQYPDYFMVNNKGTTVIQKGEVNVAFYGVNKKGFQTLLLNKKFDKQNRRVSLGDLFAEFPSVENMYEGINFTGWVDDYGKAVDKDTMVLASKYTSTYSVYATYDKVPVVMQYNYVDSITGEYKTVNDTILFEPDATYGEVIQEGLKRDAPDKNYEGMTFKNWKVVGQYQADEKVLKPIVMSFDPVYDKCNVALDLGYLNAKGQWTHAKSNKLYDSGITIADLVKDAKANIKVPEEYKGLKFTGWKASVNYDDKMEVPSRFWLELSAVYEDKTVVQTTYNYWGKDGNSKIDAKTEVLDTGKVDISALEKQAKSKGKPDSFEGLRFSDWYCYTSGAAKEDTFVDMTLSANYENCLFRVILDDQFRGDGYAEPSDFEYVQAQAVERGGKVSIPSTVKGYENITWVNTEYLTDDASKPITILGDTDLYGYGDKITDPTPDPDPTPEPDPKPEPTPTPTPDPDPTPAPGTLPEEEVRQVVDEVSKADAGEKVVVPMNNATVVPKNILQAAKGKDVDVVLDMGGYTWTINGKDIKSTSLKDINLEVKMDENVIPSNLLKKLAGDKPVRQLSLTHNGDFGFKAELTLNVGSEYQGQYGNLYYYDSSGKMVFMNAGTISAEGFVSLNFSHASEYALVMGEYMGDSTPSVSANGGNTGSNGAKTGDAAPVIPLAVAAIIALAAAGVIVKRKALKDS